MSENQKPFETKPENYEGYTGFQPRLRKVVKTELNLGQLFLGLVLIFGGLLFLAKNMGWLDFKVSVEWSRFWPILLIFAGLAMVKTKSLLTSVLGIIAVLLTFGIVAWVIFGSGLCGFGR